MSTVIMAACWPLRMPPTIKAVLMSLADQANDQGSCWPTCRTLCERTCLSERAVRSAIGWLESKGAVVINRRERANGAQSSNEYVLLPDVLASTADDEPAEEAGGVLGVGTNGVAGDDDLSPPPGTTCRPPPAPRAPPPCTTCTPPLHHVHPHSIEPSFEQSVELIPPNPPDRGASRGSSKPLHVDPSSAAEAGLMELGTWLAVCKAAGEAPIPPDDPVFAYCATVGISRDLLGLHWREFKRRRGHSRKRQRGVKGWRQAFRNSVQDNWFRLWFTKPGEEWAQLTTQGVQAQRLADEEDARRPAAVAAGGGDD